MFSKRRVSIHADTKQRIKNAYNQGLFSSASDVGLVIPISRVLLLLARLLATSSAGYSNSCHPVMTAVY